MSSVFKYTSSVTFDDTMTDVDGLVDQQLVLLDQVVFHLFMVIQIV